MKKQEFPQRIITLGLFSCMLLTPVCAQRQMNASANLDQRISNQHSRVARALSQGNIDKAKADQLNKTLDDLARQIKSARQANGGVLKAEQKLEFENVLNQNNQLIKSVEQAGQSVLQSGNAIGPAWQTGPDGAQNPNSLLKKMKTEEKRELRQERQALEQKLEQQQLDYERKMLPKLGDQRKDILKQQSEVKQIRSEQGAN